LACLTFVLVNELVFVMPLRIT